MSDLSEFLLARIAEDEEVARAADDSHRTGERRIEGPAAFTRHVERHDPARVLAECEAKRRIVEKAQEILDQEVVNNDEAWVAEFMLAQVALPYADHPDFRAEWAH